ncbi:hypothetical protein O9A_01125 [Bartonella koehlerae C-29]|uniref:Uncharacterized protein n=1 Tax=Bartonella koehlerae C-29 TaxID=1134510 RepID=A0A067W6S4_9HYPH|nr:hypothetical protein O9A_01125 [Bartonella koehlerae C-29]
MILNKSNIVIARCIFLVVCLRFWTFKKLGLIDFVGDF